MLFDVDISMMLTVKAKSIIEAEDISETLLAEYIGEGTYGPTEYFSIKAHKVPKGEIRLQIDNVQD